MSNKPKTDADFARLAQDIKQWGKEQGFSQVGITDIDLSQAEQRLLQWLAAGYHGEMDYMARHGSKRSRPDELIPGILSVISVRMNYLPPGADDFEQALADSQRAFVSRYALGRDYHKLMRNRLQKLAVLIQEAIGEFGYRAFSDSAPVLEKPLAQKAGLGWIGKHTNLVNTGESGWFFLGELYTDLPLPADPPESDHCGRCHACIDACPTGAIVAPYQLDARLCISYLTIELDGAIPEPLRPLLGNRIYGCDDCQIACPWNRFAQTTLEPDFYPRNGLDKASLIELFDWSEEDFDRRLQGSPIRRIGHQRWLRNIAVAMGNAEPDEKIRQALERRWGDASTMLREHIEWALTRQNNAKLPSS